MAADSRALRSLAELDAALDGRPMVLFLGNGARKQYADVDGAVTALVSRLLANLPAKFVAVYGGDTFVPEKPDLGVVMKRIQETLFVPLLAVVGWEDHDAHVDFTWRYM